MKAPWSISGTVVSGTGKAAFFTGLDWVGDQCRQNFGFIPYPGTLNLAIDEASRNLLDDPALGSWTPLVSPDPSFCESKARPIRIGPVAGALIQPSSAAHVHGRKVVEILAPVRLREVLALSDGDRVEIRSDVPDPSRPALQVRAVLFDLDGTLIDSIEAYYRLVEIALERLGLPPVRRETIAEAAGHVGFQWDRILTPMPGKTMAETRQAAWTAIEDLYSDFFLNHIRPFQATGPVLRLLNARRVKMGIVTSTPGKNIGDKMTLLERENLSGLMEVVVSGEDAARKKPHPDPLLLGCRKMGLDPEACVYVGDTAMDMEAGKAAGMKTVGVLTGFDGPKTLLKHRPDHVIESIADLPWVIRLYPDPVPGSSF